MQYINRQYRRSGTLWEGRFRSCLVQQDDYLLNCQRYIELNPVRAGVVERPADYQWSSYRANAQGEASTLLTPHLLYLQLGSDAGERQRNYREFFRHELEPGMVDAIRSATGGRVMSGHSQAQIPMRHFPPCLLIAALDEPRRRQKTSPGLTIRLPRLPGAA